METTKETRELDRPFGIAWGQVYGIEHRLVSQPAEEFLPQLRYLGATAARITFYWGQIESTPGEYSWRAVDAFLSQLTSGDEAWVAIASSSSWATRTPSTLIPSSPANDADQYYRLVRALVERAAGRVRYWQMEFELGGPFWAGSAREYVEQLGTFTRAVKDADPDAQVVLGGFLDDAYDATIARASNTAAQPASLRQLPFKAVTAVLRWRRRRLYEYLLAHAQNLFDVLDVHLYQDPYTIVATLGYFRRVMTAHGYDRPIFIGEYNGPALVAFPENRRHLKPVMQAMRSLSKSLRTRDAAKADTLGAAERRAIAGLYEQMPQLPAQLQMFMQGCPPHLRAKRDRINCREIIMRTVLALSNGAQKTFCFNLAPELANRPHQVLSLMFNNYRLMDYDGGSLRHYLPPADSFRRMTSELHGIQRVRRITLTDRPAMYLFEVQRGRNPPCLVVWEQRDAFTGEDQPPTFLEWSWPYAGGASVDVRAVDALGAVVPARIEDGIVRLPLSVTPVFIQPRNAGAPAHRSVTTAAE